MIGSVEKGSVVSVRSWELNERENRFDEESMEIK
jgi:hypothetical protein